jgi:putative tricarboxylic transport membrane protein
MRHAGAALLAALLAAAPAGAEALFPTRTIRIVSPFAAGAISDVSLRLIADQLGQRLGTRVIIDNQPRAGGVTAAMAVLSAPADGHTLALLSNSTAISVALFKSIPYDPVNDFAPISQISSFANVLATNVASTHRTLGDFIAAARARPGQLNVGTTIVGSSNHLTAALFKSMTGLDFAIIPYRGPGDLLVAVQRMDVDMIIQSYGALKPAIDDKQLRALASTTATRADTMPEIPTVQESGVPAFEVVTWNGLFAPAGTPPEIVQILNRELQAVLRSEEIRRRLVALGVAPEPSTPEALGARLRGDIDKWARVIADAGIEKQ